MAGVESEDGPGQDEAEGLAGVRASKRQPLKSLT